MSDEFNNPNLDPNEEDDLVELINEATEDGRKIIVFSF